MKQAAGTLAWLSTWGLPHMFSTAEIPWAEAACASMYLPVFGSSRRREEGGKAFVRGRRRKEEERPLHGVGKRRETLSFGSSELRK